MNKEKITAADFMLEQTLAEKSPDLHSRFRNSVVVLSQMLSGYQQVFPNFTDHTELHSMNVLAFCNSLIGPENIGFLNEDEIYILLMACYVHDIGMGIRESDYHDFLRDVRMEKYLNNVNEDDMQQTIRKLHHEFSGLFIRKYAGLFDIPSEEHLFAIIQASRGHRKTDLLDESRYPSKMKVPNGNTVCLPYLSLLIRLADEIDVAADRNSILLYCMCDSSDEGAVMAFATHEAIRTIRIEPDSFVLHVKTEEEHVRESVRELAEKMQETLDYCREVADTRSRAKLSQQKIVINYIKEPE
ncbi:MAG: hypothetical protein K5668_03435 [Lachnospiraceae bacterium]|nr:hypothetical protein [Lachnospiraceae bacterium]